jgi:hypothetical protein
LPPGEERNICDARNIRAAMTRQGRFTILPRECCANLLAHVASTMWNQPLASVQFCTIKAVQISFFLILSDVDIT